MDPEKDDRHAFYFCMAACLLSFLLFTACAVMQTEVPPPDQTVFADEKLLGAIRQ